MYWKSLSNNKELLLKIAELEMQSVCVPGHMIEEPVYALCSQSNKALQKTEVVPYRNGISLYLNK